MSGVEDKSPYPTFLLQKIRNNENKLSKQIEMEKEMEKNNIIKFPLPWYKRVHISRYVIAIILLAIMIVFTSLTVHAEESASYNYYCNYEWEQDSKIFRKEYYLSSPIPLAMAELITKNGSSDGVYYVVFDKYNTDDVLNLAMTNTLDGFTCRYKYYIDDEIKSDYNLGSNTNIQTPISNGKVTTNMPIFNSYESAYNYLNYGDTSGQINKPTIDTDTLDHKDSSYTLTGFTANKDITATWTGTTERTKLTELTPNEYVHAYIGYAYKNAPGQIAKRDEYEKFFPMDDKIATIDWNSIQPDDDTLFLRYVQFYPMYTADTGFFGTFIYGNPSTIWFRNDGTIESVESNGIMNYDFSTDTIHTEIPLPEISNISHRGFTIENIGEYYVDVMVNTYLYGVKLIAPYGMGAVVATDYATKPDKTWIYDQEFYQPSLHSDIAIKQTNIDIERDFGIDTITPMINAFKRWSITYPHVKQLPDYTWQMVGCQTQYNDTHVYKQDSQLTDFEQLVKSGQATTVFYVRFYNDNAETGQWVKYTYSDGFGSLENGGITDGTIVSGAVDVDSNGNVHINESNGYVDENGNISYPVFGTDSGIGADVTLNGFKDTLEEFVSAVGNLPEYISKLFGYLPWWCTALIGLAIGAVVILRFLGR